MLGVKKTTLILAAIVGILLGITVANTFAQESRPNTKILSTTIEIGERPLWRKILRGAARVVTLGMVQAATDTLKQGQPFSFAFDHNGIDTDGYQIFINTAAVATIPVTALVNGTVTHPFPQGLQKGTYVFTATAFGPGGDSAQSLPLNLSVTAGNPSAPGQGRIIK